MPLAKSTRVLKRFQPHSLFLNHTRVVLARYCFSSMSSHFRYALGELLPRQIKSTVYSLSRGVPRYEKRPATWHGHPQNNTSRSSSSSCLICRKRISDVALGVLGLANFAQLGDTDGYGVMHLHLLNRTQRLPRRRYVRKYPCHSSEKTPPDVLLYRVLPSKLQASIDFRGGSIILLQHWLKYRTDLFATSAIDTEFIIDHSMNEAACVWRHRNCFFRANVSTGRTAGALVFLEPIVHVLFPLHVCFYDLGRYARSHGMRWHVFRNDCAGSDYRTISDFDPL